MFSIEVSTDNTYNKTYYVTTSFMGGWMSGYTWCRANDLDVMTFDSQDEHDKFINNIQANMAYYNPILTVYDKGGSPSGIRLILGTYQNHIQKYASNGFFYYDTGEPVYPKITYHWIPNQPETLNGVQWCNTVESHGPGSNGLNDFFCDTDTGFRLYPACQQVVLINRKKGMEPNPIV